MRPRPTVRWLTPPLDRSSRKQQQTLFRRRPRRRSEHERVRRRGHRRRRRRSLRRVGPDPRPAPGRWWSTPASRATPRPPTCTGFLGSGRAAAAELLAAGRDEVAGYGGDLVAGTVTERRARSTPARLPGPAADGGDCARRVLVTTGLRDDIPDIPGVRERWGRDVLHCPYCHGYEVRDQPLGVLGGTPEAVDPRAARPPVVRRRGVLRPRHRSPPNSASSSSPAPSASSRVRSPARSSRTTT